MAAAALCAQNGTDGRCIIATRACSDFSRFFADRLDDSVFVFDKGEAALAAWHRLSGIRHVFCDSAPLADGMSGYRMAMRLRTAQHSPSAVSLYLFTGSVEGPDHGALLEKIGVARMVPRSPELVARIVGALPMPTLTDSVPPHADADLLPRIAACNDLLHCLMGPIAAKLIERARPELAVTDENIRSYVDRIAAQIAAAPMREEFVRKAWREV